MLVLSPTRELSAQIVESFQTYGRYLRPRVALAIGGVPINRRSARFAAASTSWSRRPAACST